MGSSDRRKLCDSQWKMNPTIWLSLALAVITLSTPTQSTEPRVVCYYTNWSVYRPGTAKYNPQNINPYLCTHLIYAFGGFTKDNTLKPFDKYQDIEKGGYAKFTGLKTYNKKLKTLLAIGGWNEGSTRFSPMVASREKRKEFVRNVIKFLRQNHFDGLDLDWEYPAFRDGGKPKDRENYAKLVKELREEFEKESEKTGKPRLLLTMAVPAGIEYIQKGFDLKTLNQYLDWMNLLTYDYHSAFEPAVNHHSPLYPLEEPNEYSVDNELNIDYTIKYYLENGADPEKLVLGIPTYGRSYTLFNKDAVEIGSPADGPGEQGEATREKGYLAYYEICEALKPKTTRPKKAASDEDSDEDSEEEQEEPWNVMHPNPNAMGPVAYKGNQWVGYDDLDIVRKKAEYVAENGLGGIMFWSIDNDDFRGTCHGKPYPLIEAAKEAYIVRLGSTDNSVTDRPSRASTTVRSTSNRRRNRPRGTTTTARPASKTTKRNKSEALVSSTTPSWAINTPEPPTTPDPGSDFKCTDEGFFPHPRDCKKYFWCLDSGPSNLGIVAHQFTCPSGLFFNKAADSCDFARNVPCKKSAATTKAPTAKAITTTLTTTSPTTRKPVKLNTKSSSLFRTSTTTTTPEPEPEEEYEDDLVEDSGDIEAEDPKVIKELIDLIKKVGGVEQLEKQLHLSEPVSTDGSAITTASPLNKRLYQKVLEKTRSKFNGNSISETNSDIGQYSRRGPQNAGLEPSADRDKIVRKDRPQYTTITRSRASTTSAPDPEQDLEDIPVEKVRHQARAALEPRVATSPKPLQYVNIRRARPLATSDTADDTASRNALFERTETFVTVGETPGTLDVSNARRENIPEYVTIRRQRPTTEEAVTEEYHSGEVDEVQETALEREISSPPSLSQPQYTSIVRVRSTTTTASPEKESPEPTTVLAVQISSLLNSPSSAEEEDTETPQSTVADVTETVPPTTTTTTTTTPTPTTTTTTTPSPTTTTTTTKASPSAPTRRTIIRRRGSSTTTQATPTSSQAPRKSFQRRTKATAPPDSDAVTEVTLGTTSKYTRRTPNFKATKNPNRATKTPEIPTESPETAAKTPEGTLKVEIGGKRTRRPSFSNNAVRSERPTRNFVRRRLGGANATTSTTSSKTTSTTPSPATSASSTTSATTRRPFRVAARRRLPSTVIPSKTTTTTTEAPTTIMYSEEYLQDIDDNGENNISTSTTRLSSTPSESTKASPIPLALSISTRTSTKPSTTTSASSSTPTRRPFRVVARRRLPSTVIPSKSTTTTTEVPTTIVYNEEYLQDINENESTEDPIILDRPTGNRNKTRRPLMLKEDSVDQNPSATNEEEKKRHSKKYSASFKQNQLDEVLKQREKLRNSQEEVELTTTEGAVKTTVDDNDAETALAIAAHQLLSAPLPSIASYEDDPKTTRKTKPTTIHEYQYTSPAYEQYSTKNSFDDSTVIKTTLGSIGTDFAQTTGSVFDVSTPFVKTSTKTYPSTSTSFRTRVSTPSGFTSADLLSSLSPSTVQFRNIPSETRFSNPSTVRLPSPSPSFSGVSTTLSPSTTRYVGSSEKLVSVPVDDYSFTTGGYSSISQEPAYFTREYLLESPVTKTYDDEYQYLSPTTPESTTRQKPRKITYRKISTTIQPPIDSYVPEVKPRRVSHRKPIEKVPIPFEKAPIAFEKAPIPYEKAPIPFEKAPIPYEKAPIPFEKAPSPVKVPTKYRPVENYDYYEDGAENVAVKYSEGTKVVLHSKGTIECLDIGNFPHPSSCKKFISCARLENGSFLGWEYICPKGLSFDPIGGICNWSAGLGCHEKDIA